MNILDRVKNYANGARVLWDWLGEGSEVVDKELAQQRADICNKCVKNQQGNMVTKSIAWSIKEQTDLKHDLRLTVDGEKGLKTCEVCECWLQLKIWVPMHQLRKQETDEDRSKWPTWCWMRNEP